MKRREELRVAHQYRFGSEGVEPPDEPTETTFTDWGIDLDPEPSESRIDRPSASEFGVDDRVEVRTRPTNAGDQQTLGTDPEQRTLGDGPDSESGSESESADEGEGDI